MPIVYLLRRFQILKVDLDIHQGSIRRNETTASTKEMIDEDDVSRLFSVFISLDLHLECNTYVWKIYTDQTQNHKNLHIKWKPLKSLMLLSLSNTLILSNGFIVFRWISVKMVHFQEWRLNWCNIKKISNKIFNFYTYANIFIQNLFLLKFFFR